MSPPRSLPIVDLGPFRTDETSAAASATAEALGRACHEVGFCYVSGHGVAEAETRAAEIAARAFFALPESDRLAIQMVRSAQFRGYTPVGYEMTGGRPDHRDQIDIGRDHPVIRAPASEVPAAHTGASRPQAWSRLRGPNQWPSALPALRPAVTAWMDSMALLSRCALRALSVALGQQPGHFDDAVDPLPEELLKVIRYPAGSEPGGQGVGPHRDIGFLTFLHQDEVGGLAVQLPSGEFVGAPHVPGAFVMNLGEMLQLVTNGYLKATVHRVVSPPAGRERVSMAYFFNPRLEATLRLLELPADLAAAAPGGESADPTNPILADYGFNMLKVRLRAHPDVAARHHADLLSGL